MFPRTVLSVVGLLAVHLLVTDASAEPSRLGVTVVDNGSPRGALVTHVRQGYPATQMRRAGSSEDYYLAANAHVILEINGTRVYSAAACIREIVSSPRNATLKVYNRYRRTTKDYSVVLNGNAVGDSGHGSVFTFDSDDRHAVSPHEADNSDSVTSFSFGSSNWIPGSKHPSAAHVVAGERESDWVPAPGYRWSRRSKDFGVRWSPWAKHTDHPHVIAGLIEGRWVPAPGYKWSNREQWKVTKNPDYWDSDSFDSPEAESPSNSSTMSLSRIGPRLIR